MTAVGERLVVRVMVTDVWDQVSLSVDAGTTVAELKRLALERARSHPAADLGDYLVKFRGATVLDERETLAAIGARNQSSLIVLSARRQPVR
jgi:hypothetical protein